MKKKAILISVIIVVLIAGIFVFGNKKFSFGTSDNKEKTTAASVSSKVSVQVEKAKVVEKTSGKTYKATLEAFEEGIVSSKVSAKVVQVLFENGKSVTKGDVLVVLDAQDIRNQLESAQTQLASSQANLQKQEANLALAQDNYDRQKALYAQGATTQASYDNVESALKVAKADVATAKVNIQSARVNVDNLRETLADTVIKAPISGLVDERSVNVGQFASPGAVLAKVKRISPIYAVIEVEQSEANLIKVGQKAQIKVDGFKNAFSGTVQSIAVSADPSARVFKCKIQVDNPDKSLKPGIFAKAEIVGDQKVQMVTLPIAALAGNEGSYYVFINDNGIARKRTVTIGDTTGDLVEIISGIKKGEGVISTNVNMLQDGDAVRVVSE